MPKSNKYNGPVQSSMHREQFFSIKFSTSCTHIKTHKSYMQACNYSVHEAEFRVLSHCFFQVV